MPSKDNIIPPTIRISPTYVIFFLSNVHRLRLSILDKARLKRHNISELRLLLAEHSIGAFGKIILKAGKQDKLIRDFLELFENAQENRGYIVGSAGACKI
jgi:hypothetical protein